MEGLKRLTNQCASFPGEGAGVNRPKNRDSATGKKILGSKSNCSSNYVPIVPLSAILRAAPTGFRLEKPAPQLPITLLALDCVEWLNWVGDCIASCRLSRYNRLPIVNERKNEKEK